MQITPDAAYAALKRLDGDMMPSDDGMIIQNALELWEYDREQLREKEAELKKLRGMMTIDEPAAYGNDCRSGKCDY